MSIRLACQTITWGNGQAERFDEIFATVAAAGFAGVEIGFRHISALDPLAFKASLEAHGLVLAATHVGGNLEDAEQAKGEHGIIGDVLDFLSPLGTTNLMYSGLNVDSAAAAADGIAMLRRAAEQTAARGVRLLYHNHHWEFLRPGIMEAVLRDGGPSLGLCPDLGWVMRGGEDACAFLQRHAARVGAVHFKDFAAVGDGQVSFDVDTVTLGSGVAPLRECAAYLCSDACAVQADPLWVIAEQDSHSGPPEEAAAANGAFLQEVFTTP